MSRVVTAVAKLGVFCTVVFIAIVLFRGTSISARVSEAWAMRGCADRVEDDLDVLLLEKDPNVRSCVGPATRAVCEVETVEWWAPCGDKTPGPRRIKKTAPLGPWDCTRRHVPSGKPGWVMKFLIDGKANGATYALLRREVDKASPADRKLIDEMGFVASLLNQRQALVDAQ